MDHSEDQRLLAEISEGNPKSFEALLKKYQKLIYGYSMKLLRDKQKAEDLSQETWLRVIRHAGEYRPTGSARSWILSISRHLIIDELRAAKKWQPLDEAAYAEQADPTADLERLFTDAERDRKLHEAFQLLPETQRLILSMTLIEELSQSEISVQLGTSVGAVKATLFRARANLMKQLGIKESP